MIFVPDSGGFVEEPQFFDIHPLTVKYQKKKKVLATLSNPLRTSEYLFRKWFWSSNNPDFVYVVLNILNLPSTFGLVLAYHVMTHVWVQPQVFFVVVVVCFEHHEACVRS